jgi:hypothetical protein
MPAHDSLTHANALIAAYSFAGYVRVGQRSYSRERSSTSGRGHPPRMF